MTNQTVKVLRFIVTLLVFFYFVSYILNPEKNILINNFLLSIHEAGHFIFIPFGEFIHVLGGTFFQILVPIIFIIYFFFKRQLYSSFVICLFLGSSLINVSVYVRDAKNMYLDLLVGDIHDWNFLLSKLGILNHYVVIADFFYFFGILIIGLSLFSMFYFSLKKEVVS
jgi:hypothetical protein